MVPTARMGGYDSGLRLRQLLYGSGGAPARRVVMTDHRDEWHATSDMYCSPAPMLSPMAVAKRPVRPAGGGVEIDLWVVPGSSRSELTGLHGGAVRVRVGAPPEGGKANAEACRLIAAATGGRRVRVIRGRTSRHKVVMVTGPDVAAAEEGLRNAGVPM